MTKQIIVHLGNNIKVNRHGSGFHRANVGRNLIERCGVPRYGMVLVVAGTGNKNPSSGSGVETLASVRKASCVDGILLRNKPTFDRLRRTALMTGMKLCADTFVI